MDQLIPVKNFISGFTTCQYLRNEKVEQVALEDKQLGVHKVWSKLKHKLVQPPPELPKAEPAPCGDNESSLPAPEYAWEALYPEGSINPSGEIPGGFGFYLSGPPAFAKSLENASEAVFSYRMMIQEGWEWVKGGKVPGVFGGNGDLSYGCTGGRQEERCQCFNLRPMWRPNSVGELYAYFPLTTENRDQLLAVPPKSIENSDYGFSVGRDAFRFDRAVGRWIAVAFRIKLNDVGCTNGEIELWIDGQSVIKTDGLTLRSSQDGKIKGMHFQTFFGGNGKDWASPKDQKAWFADVSGVIVH
ncbi:hypothetical protein NLJ89_g2016 [Agrocybe chaxingu]|uniref:Polysaccharide lyase 14 domain-containing protein n=1 Tax=Agrocybe chaxingu TaxID=84603 RepID=A0A9W8K877_9AGAR|nr:hypothetical protein NLJ89_g2016 [Agrocybe chaxingu]